MTLNPDVTRPKRRSTALTPALTPRDPRLLPPTLSPDAALAYEHLSRAGRLSVADLHRLVGEARAEPVRAELSAAWLVLDVPGGLETRAGRAGYLGMASWVPAAGLLEVEAAARRLSGMSGLLGVFARALDLDHSGALGVMRALVTLGYAQGGPVGATFAFRVLAVECGPPGGGSCRLGPR